MELTGTIKLIDETKSYGTSNFKKRDLVLETKEQYPQPILISFQQATCDVLNNYKKGDEVTIGINLRGREWTNPQGETKYFNEIVGWKINKLNGQSTNVPESLESQSSDGETKSDDLPF